MSRLLELRITDGTNDLRDVGVTIYVTSSKSEAVPVELIATHGRLSYVPDPDERILIVLIRPQGSYWPMVHEGPFTQVQLIACPKLPTAGPIGWWHRAVGQVEYDEEVGKGVRIGVVDTGLARHVALLHATPIDIGSATGTGRFDDVSGHGTHVAGLIGARVGGTADYGGIAPGATLFTAQIFDADEKASTRDVADAIEALSFDHEVDVINLSLGGDSDSRVVLDAVRQAYDNGTMCIAAAGNDGDAVQYPAAFEEVSAVAALGQVGWAPKGSLAASHEPGDPAAFTCSGLYIAKFSSRGKQVGLAAPGVGLISAVPSSAFVSRAYAVMSGTSMAAPVATGVLASRLSLDLGYLRLPRDATRAAKARDILNESLRDLDLDVHLQGGGIPVVGMP